MTLMFEVEDGVLIIINIIGLTIYKIRETHSERQLFAIILVASMFVNQPLSYVSYSHIVPILRYIDNTMVPNLSVKYSEDGWILKSLVHFDRTTSPVITLWYNGCVPEDVG